MKPTGSNRLFSILSALIIFISSALLVIWSLRNTIALRNALLAVGAVLALFLFWHYARKSNFKNASDRSTSSWASYIPLILCFVILIWVVIHYLLFSSEPGQQFQELTSTWVRVLESLLVGAVTGLLLKDHPQIGRAHV